MLKKIGIDTDCEYDLEPALEYIRHDKKCSGGSIDVVFSDKIGSYRLEKMALEDYSSYIKMQLKGRD